MNALVCTSTGYDGMEEQILHVRNSNRDEAISRAYLDWRYLQGSSRPPVIFWIQQQDGTTVGMASVIFRRFWVNNETQDIAVLGDISINTELRGQGISKQLFTYINSYIESHDLFSFVMPNYLAMRGLCSTGWIKHDRLVSYVFILDPAEKLLKFIKIHKVAELTGRIFRLFFKRFYAFKSSMGLSMKVVDTYDSTFDSFWQDLPKHGTVMRDRSLQSLRWRYETHPQGKYLAAKFFHADRFVGYIIYRNEQDSICSIYDMVAVKDDYVEPMAVLFIKTQLDDESVNIVRIGLNDGNRYGPLLRKAGLIRRDENNFIIIYRLSPDAVISENNRWFNTAGDKDVKHLV